VFQWSCIFNTPFNAQPKSVKSKDLTPLTGLIILTKVCNENRELVVKKVVVSKQRLFMKYRSLKYFTQRVKEANGEIVPIN